MLELKDTEADDLYVLATSDGKTVYKSFQGRVKLNRRREKRKNARAGKVSLSITHRLATEEEIQNDREQAMALFYTEMEQAEAADDEDAAAKATEPGEGAEETNSPFVAADTDAES